MRPVLGVVALVAVVVAAVVVVAVVRKRRRRRVSAPAAEDAAAAVSAPLQEPPTEEREEEEEEEEEEKPAAVVRRRRSTLDGPGVAMAVSAYGMCGRRDSMQDAHFVVADKKGAVAAVFDGCGGPRASALCADALRDDDVARKTLRDAAAPGAATAAFLGELERRVLDESKKGGWIDATTAVVCSANARRVAVAWLGDSRAVLARHDDEHDDAKSALAAVTLTEDHNAANPAEARRVRAAGGAVGRSEHEAYASKARSLLGKFAPGLAFKANKRSAMRVYPGGIALTRCIGARPLKRHKVVTAAAQTTTLACDGSEAFLILACDGVWDVMDADAAVRVCASVAPEKAAETLVYHAHAKGSNDNLTAVVLSWP